jgi:hypothetical protein
MSDADKKHLARARFETFPDATHPKFMYHRTKPRVQVFSQKEIDELGSEWSEVYIHQEYPTVRHHWTKQERLVNNADEDAALGGGWGPTAAFAPYRGPRSAPDDQQDPVKWVDGWSVFGLSAEHGNKIKAQLLKADAAFWKSPNNNSADLASMKLAFDGVARVLFEAGTLTEKLLRNEIPALVWDSAIAGGWYRFASETPERIFPERIGHYWVWRDDTRDWRGLFRAETADWQARLLETPSRPPMGAVARLPSRKELQAGRTDIGVPALPAGGETSAPRQSRRRGFEPAMDLHWRIVAVVERHAPNWRSSNQWRSASTLKQICTDLDKDEIEVPERWRRGATQALDGAPANRWVEALEIAKTGKKLVADQIRTSIEAVRKQEHS